MNNEYDISQYIERLYMEAIKKSGDYHIAEDITQETLLAAVSALSRGKKPEKIYPWLLQILSNKYCDWLREKYRKPQISFEDYPYELYEEEINENDLDEKMEVIRRELGYLAITHREVMVRFYMRGHSIEKIASDMQIPKGTVKSRLNTGRDRVKRGVKAVENYTKQSYEPDTLYLSCSGEVGLSGEPFSLLEMSDKLAQNILILAYEKPLTEIEVAKALGVPVTFVEPVIQKLIDNELMGRTVGGKFFTDFIIYTEKDRKANFKKQLELVDNYFDLFWNEIEIGLFDLREKSYYKRQAYQCKSKLELHFCIRTLINSYIEVRNEITGIMPYSDYPYRKNGGRWIAIGQHYSANDDMDKEAEFWKYSVSGEAGLEIRNFRDARSIELRKYDTQFGKIPDQCFNEQFLKWFYELHTNVPYEKSSVAENVFRTSNLLIESGILKRNDSLQLDLPILSSNEYQEERKLSDLYSKKLSRRVHDVLLPLFQVGYVKLPPHLTSVPKWQQYMYCAESVPMAVIYKAMEKHLFLKDVKYSVPASILVVE
jgi:RNA polymerase sigma-70 factor (ECF subfamily)